MRKTITICDVCETQIEESNLFVFKSFKERRSNGIDNDDWYWVSDLCPKCTRDLAYKLSRILEHRGDIPLDISTLKRDIIKSLKCREI